MFLNRRFPSLFQTICLYFGLNTVFAVNLPLTPWTFYCFGELSIPVELAIPSFSDLLGGGILFNSDKLDNWLVSVEAFRLPISQSYGGFLGAKVTLPTREGRAYFFRIGGVAFYSKEKEKLTEESAPKMKSASKMNGCVLVGIGSSWHISHNWYFNLEGNYRLGAGGLVSMGLLYSC